MILLKRPLLSDQLILTHVHLIVTMIVANVLLLVAVNTSESSMGVGCYIFAFLANFAWLAVHVSESDWFMTGHVTKILSSDSLITIQSLALIG